VFLTDDGVVFWDYAKGEETSNPRFEVPDYIPYVKGEKYLYSSDGNWFSGGGSVGFLLNEKWISFVSSNHDIIILRNKMDSESYHLLSDIVKAIGETMAVGPWWFLSARKLRWG